MAAAAGRETLQRIGDFAGVGGEILNDPHFLLQETLPGAGGARGGRPPADRSGLLETWRRKIAPAASGTTADVCRHDAPRAASFIKPL